jgi:hypothetical protein
MKKIEKNEKKSNKKRLRETEKAKKTLIPPFSLPPISHSHSRSTLFSFFSLIQEKVRDI